MNQLTSFENYLLSLKDYEAVLYVTRCLANGAIDNEAWTFMAEFNGQNWKCEPEKLKEMIAKSLSMLELKKITMRIDAQEKKKKEKSQPDFDICACCNEHAQFHDGESDCCGAGAYDSDPMIDMER